MKWLLLWLALALATQIWLCFRVSRSSVTLALATFFLGSLAAVYTLFKYRGDEEKSVTAPFLANLVFSVLFFVAAWQVVVPLMEADAMALDDMPVARAPAPASPQPEAPLASAPTASEGASAAASAPASVDAVEGFSLALKAAGLNHVVTRLPDTSKLPAGVSDAALFSVTPMGAAAAASGASASGAASAPDYSVTLFRCESANACRNLAGAQMQQAGPDKRRILQNGLLLLSSPPPVPGDGDLTPAAVSSVFRKLQP